MHGVQCAARCARQRLDLRRRHPVRTTAIHLAALARRGTPRYSGRSHRSRSSGPGVLRITGWCCTASRLDVVPVGDRSRAATAGCILSRSRFSLAIPFMPPPAVQPLCLARPSPRRRSGCGHRPGRTRSPRPDRTPPCASSTGKPMCSWSGTRRRRTDDWLPPPTGADAAFCTGWRDGLPLSGAAPDARKLSSITDE